MSNDTKTEASEVSFVTKKVLVTFNHPLCIMVNESAIFAGAVICEYEDNKRNQMMDIPKAFRVVALADGRKLTKSINITVSWSSVVGIAELE